MNRSVGFHGIAAATEPYTWPPHIRNAIALLLPLSLAANSFGASGDDPVSYVTTRMGEVAVLPAGS